VNINNTVASTAAFFSSLPTHDPCLLQTRVSDNACAAVARMIMAAPDHVPLEQAVATIVGLLPFSDDLAENVTALNCLAVLMQHRFAAVQPHLAAILGLCCRISDHLTTGPAMLQRFTEWSCGARASLSRSLSVTPRALRRTRGVRRGTAPAGNTSGRAPAGAAGPAAGPGAPARARGRRLCPAFCREPLGQFTR
jgi:hypothetical protein